MTTITKTPVALALGFKLQIDTGTSSLKSTCPAKSKKTGLNNIDSLIDSVMHLGIKRHSAKELLSFAKERILNNCNTLPPASNEKVKLSGKCVIIVKIDDKRVDLSLPVVDANGTNNADALIISIIDIGRMHYGDNEFIVWLEEKAKDYE